RHTRFSRDWSSDVCSSDLSLEALGYWPLPAEAEPAPAPAGEAAAAGPAREPAVEVTAEAGDTAATVAAFIDRAPAASKAGDEAEIGRASCRERAWVPVGGV